MTRPLRLRAALVVALTALPAWIPRLLQAAEQTVDGRAFTLPDGFVIERVAGPPLVDRPITADFDERGRLYVADSSGSNDKVAVQLEQKPHRVVRLEDTDGDGRFDRSTVFADKLMFPEGTMWLDGSLYVAAPPSIWKLTDTDDDGVADERVEWFQGKTLTGCANDLHGPYAGPDGWVYWCKGAFASQTYERPGKPPFVTRASHVFRCRPDGSGVEPVMTGGMDNPVDVVFTTGGERVFSCTFLQHPADGRRDGLLHAVYGGVYGKVHDVLEGHARTGPDVMPVLSHLGAAAPCGLTGYESTAFGDGYRGNLFTCCFNMQKVTRHVLRPEGATFSSRDSDFLTTPDRDFHPTDVLEDADGSLVVVDTGGWYKLCCPTSQLPKPDVLGAIYLVRNAGTPKGYDPRGLKLDWKAMSPEAMTALLGDPRPAVRKRAISELGKVGLKAVQAVSRAVLFGETPEARRNAVWAATRIDHPEAKAAARHALTDHDPTVSQVAAHSASVRLDRGAVPKLLLLLHGTTQASRVAAEALGRLGDRSAVPGLLEAAAKTEDRFLRHSLIYALIEIADPEATSAGLNSESLGTRLAAVVALDQMPGGGLTAGQVIPYLRSPDRGTRELASWVVGRHPEWGNELAGLLRERLGQDGLTQADRDELTDQLARFARSEAVQTLLAEALRGPSPSRQVALRAIGQSGVKAVPKSWAEGFAAVLGSDDPALVVEAVTQARLLPPTPALAPALRAIGFDANAPDLLRLDALTAVPGGLTDVGPEIFSFLRAELDPAKSVAERTTAAGVLSRAKLNSAQLVELTENVKGAGPLEVDKLLTAFETSKDDAVGGKLVAALKASPLLSSLRVDILKPRLDKFGPDVRAHAEDLYATLNVDAAKQKAYLEEVLPTLSSGDVRRGQAVFNGVKAACLSCHAVGYLGGKVGPDLSKIGQVRSERDLLESILYPSLSFVRSYEPVTVATRDGKVVNGVLKKDSADEVVLALNASEEAHIPRPDVEEMRAGTVSVMPAGLDQQLTLQELADLLAFLKSRK